MPELERIRLDADTAARPGAAARGDFERFRAATARRADRHADGREGPPLSRASTSPPSSTPTRGSRSPTSARRSGRSSSSRSSPDGADATRPGSSSCRPSSPTRCRSSSRSGTTWRGSSRRSSSGATALGYPPVNHLVAIVASGPDAAGSPRCFARCAPGSRASRERCSAPRRSCASASRHRAQLVAKTDEPRALARRAAALLAAASPELRRRGLTAVVDVDPQSLSERPPAARLARMSGHDHDEHDHDHDARPRRTTTTTSTTSTITTEQAERRPPPDRAGADPPVRRSGAAHAGQRGRGVRRGARAARGADDRAHARRRRRRSRGDAGRDPAPAVRLQRRGRGPRRRQPGADDAGESTEVDEEGCLSLGPVRMPVERPLEVTLEGVDVAWRSVPPRAGRAPGPRRPARARPSRRHADHRSHRPGVAARGDGAAAAEARPLEVEPWPGSPSRRRRRSVRMCWSGSRRTTRSRRC